MRRAAYFLCVALLATASACDRAVNDSDPVRAMNLNDGTVKTFANESEVPAGWGICSDTECSEIPSSVPCQNLGAQVCTKNPSCRLRTTMCSSPGFPGVDGEAPPEVDAGEAPKQQPPSGDGDTDAPMTDPVPEPYPMPEVTCEQVCVPKGELLCEEILDQQGCAERADCDWGPWSCGVTSMDAPCTPEGCPAMPPCPSSCHPKAPLLCEQLDEASCNARTDCSWSPGVCPMIACADEDDPTCACEPFCQPVQPPPGEDCNVNDDCAAGQYCYIKDGCWGGTSLPIAPDESGSALRAVMGTCQDRPEMCPAVYAPVCGCDGKTYGNSCEAAGAGVNVSHHGPCDQPPPPPGTTCFSNSECPAGSYCFFKEGCGLANADPIDPEIMPYPVDEGTCQVKPDACYLLWAPVCGCDGKTYGNDCEAASNGINVAHVGECSTTKPACYVGGCSGQICSSSPGIGSTCEWLPEYECLQYTECGNFGADGGCGWKQTEAYLTCLSQKKQP